MEPSPLPPLLSPVCWPSSPPLQPSLSLAGHLGAQPARRLPLALLVRLMGMRAKQPLLRGAATGLGIEASSMEKWGPGLPSGCGGGLAGTCSEPACAELVCMCECCSVHTAGL